RSLPGIDERTACEFRTAHERSRWRLQMAEATYLDSPAALAAAGIERPPGGQVRAGPRLLLRSTGGSCAGPPALDALPVFLAGADELPERLYEQLLSEAEGVLVRGEGPQGPMSTALRGQAIRARGFDDADALLPVDGRSFSGYRLLQEYFACP